MVKIILSAAISLDGFLDDASPVRLKLSSDEDWAGVARLRAECDAILVGAGTIRRDNPSLVIRDQGLRAARLRKGMEEYILKVTVTSGGKLDPSAGFFTQGAGRKIVFAETSADLSAIEGLPGVEIIRSGKITARYIVEQLGRRGVTTLMVEGGTSVLTMFLGEGCCDVFRLAVAPFFVGDPQAPRLVGGGVFPWDKDRRMTVEKTELLGDTTVIWLKPPNDANTDKDMQYMAAAVAESRKCVPSPTAYSVGAVIVTASGEIFTGYSRETAPHNHAEEEAVTKAEKAGADLRGATMYSSMEPCTHRKSKPLSCTQLIIGRGFSRVAFALAEPPHLAPCDGCGTLTDAGLEVVRIEGFDREVEEINRHIADGI